MQRTLAHAQNKAPLPHPLSWGGSGALFDMPDLTLAEHALWAL